jgi:hypothetical protein
MAVIAGARKAKTNVSGPCTMNMVGHGSANIIPEILE